MNVAEVVDGVVMNTKVCSPDYKLKDGEIEFFENNPAWIDGDHVNGVFYPPKPYPSWTRDGVGGWTPPEPMPENNQDVNPDNYPCWWDEDNLKWVIGPLP